MSTQGTTPRRYFLFVATEFLVEAERDLAADIVAKRQAITPAPFPAGLPARAKLIKVVSEEWLDLDDREIFLYEGLDDILGATEDELQTAGLSDTEIQKILNFLAAL